MAKRRRFRGKRRKAKLSLRRVNAKVNHLLKDVEIKEFIQNQPTMAQQDNAMQVVEITGIAQGSDYNQRIGRKINPKGLFIRMIVRGTDQAAGVGIETQPFRLIVYQTADQQTSTALTQSQLLQNASSTSLNYSNFMSTYNSDYVIERGARNESEATRILYDTGMHWVHPQFSFYSDKTEYVVNHYIPFSKLREVSYSGTSNVVTQSGAIWLAWFQGASTTLIRNNFVTYHFKLQYTDA